MGGALTTATAANTDTVDAAVSFYGVPDLSKVDVSKIKCPILAVFGTKDQMVGFSDPTAKDKLEAAFKAAGTKYEIKNYEADHAFMNTDGKRYNPECAKQALGDAIAFFKTNL